VANATNRILWWALLVALGIYVAMAHLVTLPASGPAPVATLLPAFIAVAVAVAIGSLLVRRRLLAGPIQSGEIDPATPAGLQRAIPPFIINLALSESVAILGLVLSLLSGRPIYSLLFAAASACLFWVHRPTAPDLNPPSAALLGGRPPPIG
jgi:hypothetical protein